MPSSSQRIRRRGQLRPSAPIHKNPWESFWTLAVVDVVSQLLVPIAIQVVWEFKVQAEATERMAVSAKGPRVREVPSASFFPPWGLTLGSALVILIAVARLSMTAAVRILIDKYVRDLLMTWCPWCGRIAEPEAQDSVVRSITSALTRRPRARTCKETTYLVVRLGIYVMVISSFPFFAWGGRSMWNAIVARMYHECQGVCRRYSKHESLWVNRTHAGVFIPTLSEDGLSDQAAFVEALRKECERGGVTTMPGPSTWKQTWPLPELTGVDHRNYTGPDQAIACYQVLREKHSPFTSLMLRGGHNLAAFESLVRQAKQVGVLEIYGPFLAVGYLVMTFATRLALRTKIRSLNDAKREFMLHHFMRDPETCGTYRRLFRHMYALQFGDIDYAQDFWSVKVLKDAATEKDPRLAFLKYEDDDADDHIDMRRGSCKASRLLQLHDQDKDQLKALLWGLLYAAGLSAIPAICRRWTGFGGTSVPYFSTPDFAPVLKFNVCVAFIGNLYFFTTFVRAYYSLEMKMQQTVAFDCMWRFPDENPLMTVHREEVPLLHDARDSAQALKEEGDDEAAEEDFLDGEGYRARFGTLRSDELWENLYKLDEWFNMRRYIQIDAFDERISVELMMLVAVLTLVPQLGVVAYNVRVMDAAAMRAQPVNVTVVWNLIFVFFFTFRYLMVTLAFNDMYGKHEDQLAALREHINLEIARAADASPSLTFEGSPQSEQEGPSRLRSASGSPMVSGARVLRGDRAAQFVETYQKAMERFDAPSLFFGMRVDRKLISGFSSLVALTVLPQLCSILLSFQSNGS